MDEKNAAVAVYRTHDEAEAAIRELERSGFEMQKLSIIGKEYQTEEHVIGYYNMGDRMKYWGRQGAFWGGLWGLLFGSAFFWVPGLGPLLIAGPLVAIVVTTLEGAVVAGGLTALGAGLYSMGIPKDSVLRYETALKSQKYVLIAHATDVDLAKATRILGAGALEVEAHVLQPPLAPATLEPPSEAPALDRRIPAPTLDRKIIAPATHTKAAAPVA